MFDDFEFTSRDAVVLAVLIFIALFGLVDGQVGVALLMFFFGALFLSRRRDEAPARRDRYTGGDVEIRRESRPANVDEIHRHALDAVRRANRNPDSITVLPVDLGLLTFKGDADPVIHRAWPVDDDCDYVQPFVQLRVPVAATGRVKFEILDSTGQPVFVHEDHYQLRRGRNLLVPAMRLPVHDEQEMDGRWTLRISADGMLLADHTFSWRNSEEDTVRPPLGEDGELSSEMRAVLQASRLQNLSLDDLLAGQEDDENDARQSAR